MRLILEPNLSDPDAVYERIIALQEKVDTKDLPRVNARLILLLANHIGDEEAISEAITLAGRGKKA